MSTLRLMISARKKAEFVSDRVDVKIGNDDFVRFVLTYILESRTDI